MLSSLGLGSSLCLGAQPLGPGARGGPRFTAGAAGAGDAYFPFAGNGGYDVGHYDLDITYTPPTPAPAPLVDHPTDKATYSFEITVPAGKVAVANGRPTRDPVTAGGWTTWYWDAPDLQASYLTTASVGDYELTTSATSSGLPIIDAVDDALTAGNRAITEASLALQPEMIEYFENAFGPYPFSAFGSIVDDDTVGYALETQTRPVYSRVARESTVAHELAHQWFGNAVGRSAGRTSGSTRAGPRTQSGCGAKPPAATPCRRCSRA